MAIPSPSYLHSSAPRPHFDLFAPLRYWVNRIEVKKERFAHFVCKLIPCTCPFERDFKILGRAFHIPPLCKLNPLYQELVSLRFRALVYLEGDCGVDVTQYIC